MRVNISNHNYSVLLLIIASVEISFGGLIMRNIDYADAWQISFFRSLGFIFSVTIVLFNKYRFNLFKDIIKIGWMGILGALFLMSAHLLFILSFSKTTIANTLFTLSFIPFLTAILGLILLCFFWGAILHGFMNIVFIFSSRFLYASEITLFMLIEFTLGPFWVWIFLDETFSNNTFFGGIIVLLSVATYSFLEMYNQKNIPNKKFTMYNIF